MEVNQGYVFLAKTHHFIDYSETSQENPYIARCDILT